MSVAKRKDEKLWEQVKKYIQGNEPIWNARMAQQSVRLYKDLGGEYIGPKKKDNSLKKWTDEEWTYVNNNSERYLPKKVIEKLTPNEKKIASKGKKLGTRKGYPEIINKKMKEEGIY